MNESVTTTGVRSFFKKIRIEGASEKEDTILFRIYYPAVFGGSDEDRFLLVPTTLNLKPLLPGLKGASYFFSADEWVIVLHLPDLTRFVFRVNDGDDIEEIQKVENIRARLKNFLPITDDYEIKTPSVYSVHQRVVEQFRKGRIILAGDAAHLNNPLGGMGMNSGIHDAFHLSKKIRDVLNGASEAALDEYCSTRGLGFCLRLGMNRIHITRKCTAK